MNVNKIPVINCISNLVTANDCANVLLAAGFSAIMAYEPQEMEDIARAADALVINLGTPSDRKYEAARAGGLAYNRLHKPVVIDPVGVAVSSYRRIRLKELLDIVHPDVIRCNLSEAKAILRLIADVAADADNANSNPFDNAVSNSRDCTDADNAYSNPRDYADADNVAGKLCDNTDSNPRRNADSDPHDNSYAAYYEAMSSGVMHQNLRHDPAAAGISNDTCGIDSRESSDMNMKLAPQTAMQLAQSLHTVVLISGAADVISDGVNVRLIEGGSDKLKSITGTGCMLSALCGGFAAGRECSKPERETIYDSICEASAFFKRAAELAESRLSECAGTGELRMRLIDACGSIQHNDHR